MSNFRKSSQLDIEFNSRRQFKIEELPELNSESLSIVGTSKKGPAFIPKFVSKFLKDERQIGTLNSWENIYGDYSTQEKTSGVITSKLIFDNDPSFQLTYTRILGIENYGEESEDVNNYLGFTVGDDVVSGSIEENKKNSNSFSHKSGSNGRTYFLGNVVSSSFEENTLDPTNNYISQLGFSGTTEKLGIINKIIFTSSGSNISLQKDHLDDLDSARNDISTITNNNILSGSSVSQVANPKLLIGGLKNKKNNIVNIPDDCRKIKHGENYLNYIDDCFLEKGHLVYSDFGSCKNFFNIEDNILKDKNFIASGSLGWNTKNSQIPNYEDFISGFKTACTPWVISQPINRFGISNNRQNISNKCKKLFRFHAISDGESGNNIRIRITPRKISKENLSFIEYAQFSIDIFEYNELDNVYKKSFSFDKVDLNPDSVDYICKLFGTKKEKLNRQIEKIVEEGFYEQTNNLLVVEVSDDIEDKKTIPSLIPSGFLSYPVFNIDNTKVTSLNNKNSNNSFVEDFMCKPIDYVLNILLREDNLDKKIEDKYWGVLFDKVSKTKIKDYKIFGDTFNINFLKKIENNNHYFNPVLYYSKFFKEGFINSNELNDLYNNCFHLEKILYLPQSDLDFDKWNLSLYRRDGKDPANISELQVLKDYYEYVNVDDLLVTEDANISSNSSYLSFDFFTYGGFDGVNILDRDTKRLNNVSLQRELEDQDKDLSIYKNPTYRALKLARKLSTDERNCVRDVFATPGYYHYKFLSETVDIANETKEFISVLDVPLYDKDGNIIIDNMYNFDYRNPNYSNTDFYKEKVFNNSFKNKVEKGISKTFQLFKENNLFSQFCSSYLNPCIGSDENVVFEIPASANYLIQLTSSVLGLPIDSLSSNNFVNNVICEELNDKTNNQDFYLNLSKNADHNINYFRKTTTKGITLTSDNMLIDDRYNLKRFTFNRRILLNIRKNIISLIYNGTGTNDPILFDNNHSLRFVYSKFILELNNIFQDYLNNALIKSYNVPVDRINRNSIDINNHIERFSIYITLLGISKNDLEVEDINLLSILNNISSFDNKISDSINNVLKF